MYCEYQCIVIICNEHIFATQFPTILLAEHWLKLWKERHPTIEAYYI